MSGLHRYCGRDFSQPELDLVTQLCADPALPTRAAIARELCARLGWKDANGRPKAMSARVALLRMAEDGLICLPPPANANNTNRCWPLRLPAGPLPPPLRASLDQLHPLELVAVETKADSARWNELVARHHYLGYCPLPGAQRRYFVTSHRRALALFSVSAAAWSCKPRDEYIGWDRASRAQRLHLVVGNSRFLVLPWVEVANLASAALGLLRRRIGVDWQEAYGYRPVLMETFVEAGRFKGTSYRAAGWVHLGRTTGRGKLDREHKADLAVKDVYCQPLAADFRRHLVDPP
jgi:hypothetical protein